MISRSSLHAVLPWPEPTPSAGFLRLSLGVSELVSASATHVTACSPTLILSVPERAWDKSHQNIIGKWSDDSSHGVVLIITLRF